MTFVVVRETCREIADADFLCANFSVSFIEPPDGWETPSRTPRSTNDLEPLVFSLLRAPFSFPQEPERGHVSKGLGRGESILTSLLGRMFRHF